MKRSLMIFSLLVMFFSGFATAAFAQSEDSAEVAESSVKLNGGLNLVVPEGWNTVEEERTGSRILVLSNAKTEDKIEVYHHHLTQEALAPILFDGFKSRLEDSGALLDDEDEKREIELLDGTTREGGYYVYRFLSNDITIQVHMFMFLKGTEAYNVSGYFIKAEQDDGVKAFNKIIESMTE